MALATQFESVGLAPSASPAPEKLAYRDVEAAKSLGVCQNTIRKLIDSGELASFRIGRRLLIPRSAIEDYMRRKVEEAQTA